MLAVRAKALIEGRLAPSDRRCRGAGASGAAPPHGAQFLRARRRHHDRRRDRPALPEQSLTDDSGHWSAITRAGRDARRGVAAFAGRRPNAWPSAVSLGVHGRRKAGMGETFWQFRRYRSRRSGTADRLAAIGEVAASLRARARMGSGAKPYGCGATARPSMRFTSGGSDARSTAPICWRWRSARCWCAAASASGFSATAHAPSSAASRLRRIAHELARCRRQDASLPPEAPIGRNAQIVWLSDFLSPLGELEAAMRRLARAG